MSWKRFAPLAVSFAACCLLAYIAFAPPRVEATKSCRLFPTVEQETAAEMDPYDDTIEGFTMELSDPQHRLRHHRSLSLGARAPVHVVR